ncbi:ABC transporter ATP-binding protein [Actinomadura syzygii]|uniref:ABC transporter ATP-binding protein n=1 Tax=Actinomadura syzygii TaxID=1427538 RepID=A0A5D0UG92_9ACTN|nr:ABC transporter ATP-binding protein [Actinomadura syzygii]
MLRISELVAGYGAADVLHGIDLSVGGGEIVCLLGSNGAGKTTLARCVAGLLKPRSGSVTDGGTRLDGLSPSQRARRGIALVPEDRGLFGGLTVADNLELGGFRHGRRHALDRLSLVVEIFPPLASLLPRSAGTLSGGEQQMTAIGRALMADPRFLVLDEPSLGLSPGMTRQILTALRALADDGIGIVLIEQNAALALGVGDRAAVLRRGRIAVTGAASTLLDDPMVINAYLGGRGSG